MRILMAVLTGFQTTTDRHWYRKVSRDGDVLLDEFKRSSVEVDVVAEQIWAVGADRTRRFDSLVVFCVNGGRPSLS